MADSGRRGELMRFCLLASGSKGNCLWVEADGRAVLFDNGLPYVDFQRRAALAGLDEAKATDVVVSHEHGDHIGGVGPLARALDLQVHATSALARECGHRMGNVRLRTFEAGQELDFGPLSVAALTGSHDTVDPIAFVIRRGAKSLGLATDLGVVTSLIKESFRGLDALVLEFNHDLAMLVHGPYHPVLKQRVRSRRGHLSNDQAAEALRELNHPRLRVLVLAHLSETNNTPELALKAAEAALKSSPHRPKLTVATQDRPTPTFEI